MINIVLYNNRFKLEVMITLNHEIVLLFYIGRPGINVSSIETSSRSHEFYDTKQYFAVHWSLILQDS